MCITHPEAAFWALYDGIQLAINSISPPDKYYASTQGYPEFFGQAEYFVYWYKYY
jgi:hypothetical protein